RLVATARTFAPDPGRSHLRQVAPPSVETKVPCSDVPYIVGCGLEPKPREMSVKAEGSGRLRTPAGLTTSTACALARNNVRESAAESALTQTRRGASGKLACFCQLCPESRETKSAGLC